MGNNVFVETNCCLSCLTVSTLLGSQDSYLYNITREVVEGLDTVSSIDRADETMRSNYLTS